MKRKNRKNNFQIKKTRYYYQEQDSDSVVDFYERYVKDLYHKIEIDNMTFYRIISLDLLCMGEQQEYWAVIEKNYDWKIGDVLIDENESRFIITSFPMIRPVLSDNNEWYRKTMHILFKGESDTVGEYLAKLPSN